MKNEDKKYLIGLLVGAMAGIVDVIPMIIMDLTWDANLSAFSLWVVTGFLTAATNLKMLPAWKGLLVAFLVLTPCAILIGWKEPVSLLPILGMTAILGTLQGWLIGRLERKS